MGLVSFGVPVVTRPFQIRSTATAAFTAGKLSETVAEVDKLERDGLQHKSSKWEKFSEKWNADRQILMSVMHHHYVSKDLAKQNAVRQTSLFLPLLPTHYGTLNASSSSCLFWLRSCLFCASRNRNNHVFIVTLDTLPAVTVAQPQTVITITQLTLWYPSNKNTKFTPGCGGISRETQGSSLLLSLFVTVLKPHLKQFHHFWPCPNRTSGREPTSEVHYARCPLTRHVFAPLKVTRSWRAGMGHSSPLKYSICCAMWSS